MTSGVDIAGVGLHPFGRFPDTDIGTLGATAVREALADADVAGASIEACFCATAYGGVATGHRVLGRLGLTGMPIVDVEAGCASGAAALALATTAIAGGRYERVLVVGVERMPKGMIRSSFFEPWQEQAGLTPAPAYFALRAQRLLRDTGLSKDDLAAVVVKNRRHGADNPNALFRAEVTMDDVLASRVVCEPLHLWMLCTPDDGAAALVVERSGGSNGTRAVRLAAAALRSHLPGSVLAESTPLSGIDDAGIPTASELAAREAYEDAGIGPGDVDVVECQDTDAARELLALQELGLCEAGEQAKLLADGALSIGGRLPVNPSGGLLSKGEPLGASALGQVVELVRQLRGEAGNRQVDRARVGLAHTIGRGANAGVVVVTR